MPDRNLPNDDFVYCLEKFLGKLDTAKKMRDDCLASTKHAQTNPDTNRDTLFDAHLDFLLHSAVKQAYQQRKLDYSQATNNLREAGRDVLNECNGLFGDVLRQLSNENAKAWGNYKVTLANYENDIKDFPRHSDIYPQITEYKTLIAELEQSRPLTAATDVISEPFLWLHDTEKTGFFEKHHRALQLAKEIKSKLDDAQRLANIYQQEQAKLNKGELANQQRHEEANKFRIRGIVVTLAVAAGSAALTWHLASSRTTQGPDPKAADTTKVPAQVSPLANPTDTGEE